MRKAPHVKHGDVARPSVFVPHRHDPDLAGNQTDPGGLGPTELPFAPGPGFQVTL
jgi:hypothetical protein